jgi:hypothetical protein
MAQLRVGRVERQHAVGLARQAERPAAAPADQRGRLAPLRERGDQRLAEQVLVDVDALHGDILYILYRIYRN